MVILSEDIVKSKNFGPYKTDTTEDLIKNNNQNILILKDFYERKLHKKFDMNYINAKSMIENTDENDILRFYLILLTAFCKSNH